MSGNYFNIFQTRPAKIFPSESDNSYPNVLLTPFLSPHPPHIPKELSSDPDFHEKFYIPFTFVNVILVSSVLLFSILVIFMNTLVIVGILKRRSGHATDYYLINLAVMDVVVGFIVVPLMGIVVIVGYFPLSKMFCNLWVFTDYFLIVTSAIGHCVLLLNYFCMIRFPGTYRKCKKTHIIIISFIWLLSLAFWVPPFVNNLSKYYPNGVCGYNIHYNHYYTLYIGTTGFLIPLFISISCAIYSVVILRRKIQDRLFYVIPLKVDKMASPISRKRLWSQRVILETNYILTSQAVAKKHFPLVLFLLVLFVFCRIIFYIYFWVGAFVGNVFPPDLSNGIFWIMHSNAGLSPIIHILIDSDLRLEIKKMFCRRFRSSVQPSASVDLNSNSKNVIPTLTKS